MNTAPPFPTSVSLCDHPWFRHRLWTIWLIWLMHLLIPAFALAETDAVHMANGIKIGDATSDSVIIWTRLTKHVQRNIDGKPFPKVAKGQSDTKGIENLNAMEGSVPGAAGDVRVHYWLGNDQSQRKSTDWLAVDTDTISRMASGKIKVAALNRVTLRNITTDLFMKINFVLF